MKSLKKFKNLLLGTLISVMVIMFPLPTMAGVSFGINISLPPAVVFMGEPDLIVLPETDVYAVPNVSVDIFFHNGWWWRPWEGRWYRSRHHNSGWHHYRHTPSFYRDVPSGWRNDYRGHHWKGHSWNGQRIPHGKVQKNWRHWKKSKHWKKRENWGGRDDRRHDRKQDKRHYNKQDDRHDKRQDKRHYNKQDDRQDSRHDKKKDKRHNKRQDDDDDNKSRK